MILCIDIGNTNIVSAIWNGKNFTNHSRIETNKEKFDHLRELDINSIAISSVVPIITEQYCNEFKNEYNISPLVINHNNCGIKLSIDDPKEVGSDRICNVYAAKELFDGPIIVVDFGSATTYDVINDSGEFIGGAISPGVDVSARNLVERAALLNEVSFTFPNNVIGKNTLSNLQAGIMYAGVDAVDGMIRRIIKELNRNPIVILTGGFSSILSPKLKIKHQLIPMLTLEGIRSIYDYNTI